LSANLIKGLAVPKQYQFWCRKILPTISSEELSNLLLSAVAVPADLLKVDGSLGPESATFLEAAAPLPAAAQARNEEFQAAAKALRKRPTQPADSSKPQYWQGPPVNSSWTKEDPF
jgi:hypothetical protein